MNIIEKLEVPLSVAQMNNVDAFVKGKVFPLAVESADSFTEYADNLKANFTAAKEAITDETLQDANVRAALTYATAIYRDSVYYLAGRKKLLGLGVNNKYLEAYAVAKVAVDASKLS